MRLGLIAAAAALTMTTAATAQTAEQGQYAGQLRAMFTSVAAGTCPADLMADALLKACQEQLPQMLPALKAGGPIKAITFLKSEQANGERYEQYQVTFTNGAPSKWTIGGLQDGKFRAVFSLGD
ncbi:hypothetical protein ACQKJZ_10775 [Sphingomonas sp. NPDC019816]|uniref:hypothetical protein n=1 Tax=Sphingomonas sp. NPDC019816 TaxID=3390679 RepID=UPI003CFD3EF0